MNDKDIEQEIIDKGLTYPRVTNDQIDALMDKVSCHCHLVEGTTTTVITAVLHMNHIKFTLATEIMACVDPRNYNEEIGRKYGIEKAKAAARNKLWELEGYALAKAIAATEGSHIDRMKVEIKQLGERTAALNKFIGSRAYMNLINDDQNDLIDQLAHMTDYETILGARLAKAERTL